MSLEATFKDCTETHQINGFISITFFFLNALVDHPKETGHRLRVVWMKWTGKGHKIGGSVI